MSSPGTNKVDFEVVEGVAVVTLDHYPVNTLTNAVQLGIEDASKRVSGDSSIKAVIVRGAGLRALCAGADIQDLNKPHDRYPEKNFVECFEDLDVPVVALLQGFTLGGGFELSLGCHYRIITPNGFVGLPEVNIGLLPGGQGTQRLPRLVGVETALQIMLTGQHLPAKMALQAKVVDKILSKDTIKSTEAQLKEALLFVGDILKQGTDLKTRRISQMPPPALAKDSLKKASKIISRRRNELAPKKILECVKAACQSGSFQEGVEKEQELFFEVLVSKEAKCLQHIFFAERAAAKVPKEFKATPQKLSTVGVIGAGTMGTGIAMCFAQIGKKVCLLDVKEEYVKRGMKTIKFNYDRSVKRGSKKQAQVDKYIANITPTTEYETLKNCDLIVEAVFEDMKLKKQIFKKLDETVNKGAILASNTSYLDIDDMVRHLPEDRRQKVIGMHFFSPANVMKLVEVIKGKDTDASTISTIMQVSSRMGKWPVLVNNSYGFAGNRMLARYSQVALGLVLQGVAPRAIDQCAYKFGMPMGPLRMSDLVGLDIGYQARKRNGEVDEKLNPVDALIAKGRLGMKSGGGWYDYEGGRKQVDSAEAEGIIAQVVKNNGLPPVKLSEKEIEERLFYPVINEGFRVLEDKVAFQPQDIDVVFAHGYNWPRVTGGPMFHGDLVGPKQVLSVLQKVYAETADEIFKPSPLLVEVANSGMTLAKYWKKNHQNFIFKGPKAKL